MGKLFRISFLYYCWVALDKKKHYMGGPVWRGAFVREVTVALWLILRGIAKALKINLKVRTLTESF